MHGSRVYFGQVIAASDTELLGLHAELAQVASASHIGRVLFDGELVAILNSKITAVVLEHVVAQAKAKREPLTKVGLQQCVRQSVEKVNEIEGTSLLIPRRSVTLKYGDVDLTEVRVSHTLEHVHLQWMACIKFLAVLRESMVSLVCEEHLRNRNTEVGAEAQLKFCSDVLHDAKMVRDDINGLVGDTASLTADQVMQLVQKEACPH